MLHPVDFDAVVTCDGVGGHYPDQMHSGVGWWTGSLLILFTKANGVVVVHDGHETSKRFALRFGHGAINCQHYAATVTMLGKGDEELLRYGIRTFNVPGAYITTAGDHVSMRLFDADGKPFDETTGMRQIRHLMQTDQIPIPVNEHAKGRIVERHDLSQHYATAEG